MACFAAAVFCFLRFIKNIPIPAIAPLITRTPVTDPAMIPMLSLSFEVFVLVGVEVIFVERGLLLVNEEDFFVDAFDDEYDFKVDEEDVNGGD